MSAPVIDSYQIHTHSLHTSKHNNNNNNNWPKPHPQQSNTPSQHHQNSQPSTSSNPNNNITTTPSDLRNHNQNHIQNLSKHQNHRLSSIRPISIVQQPSSIQQYPSQPSPHMNDATQKRLSIYPQHNSGRPVSNLLHPQASLSRVSTGSTISSNSTFHSQPPMATGALHQNMYPSHPPPINHMNRRTPSTSSNASASPHSSVRRSSSTRSSNVSSYVALLRKQKATVWCDRSQAEDPRIMAAQRLAKERAEREVAALPSQSSQAHHLHGSTGSVGATGSAGARRTPPNSTAGSFTTGVARKIRHHGAQKATTYAGGNMAGAGVPMRLSATEIDDDEEEEGAGERLGSLRNPMDDTDWDAQFYGAAPIRGLHARTASGQSRGGHAGSLPGRTVTTETSPPSGSPDDLTPGNSKGKDYFSKISAETGERNKAKEDELRRRGSVDERAMTMTSGRLFVANPDADSD